MLFRLLLCPNTPHEPLVPFLNGRCGVARKEAGGPGAARRGVEAALSSHAQGGLGRAAAFASRPAGHTLWSPGQWATRGKAVGGQAGHRAGVGVGRCVCPPSAFLYVGRLRAVRSELGQATESPTNDAPVRGQLAHVSGVTDRHQQVLVRACCPQAVGTLYFLRPCCWSQHSQLRPAPGLKEPAQANLEKSATTRQRRHSELMLVSQDSLSFARIGI
jgi:hypothetical protein